MTHLTALSQEQAFRACSTKSTSSFLLLPKAAEAGSAMKTFLCYPASDDRHLRDRTRN